jgi:hypothetical protein
MKTPKKISKHYHVEDGSYSLKTLMEMYGEDAMVCVDTVPYEGQYITICRLEDEPPKEKRKKKHVD